MEVAHPSTLCVPCRTGKVAQLILGKEDVLADPSPARMLRVWHKMPVTFRRAVVVATRFLKDL